MKKIIFILLYFLSFNTILKAQLDNVFPIWEEAQNLIVEGDLESAYIKAKEALELSKEKDLKDAMINSLRLMSLISQKQEKTEMVLRHYLEILDINLKRGDNEDKMEAFLTIANFYKKQELYKKSIQYYHNALQYISHTNEYHAKEHIWDELANVHFESEQFDSSRIYNQFLIDFHSEKKEKELELFYIQKRADTWMAQDQYLKAIQEYQIIKNKAQKNNDNKNYVTAINNIGIAYTRQKEHQKALDFLLEANDICNHKPLVDLAILWNNIGIAYMNINDPKNALQYLKDAQKITSNKKEKIKLNHRIAETYFKLNDLYNASHYNDLVKGEASNNNYISLLSQSYKTRADIQQQLFNFEEAFDAYEKHLQLEKQLSLNQDKEKQRLLELKNKLERSEKEIKLELAAREIEENRIKAEREKLEFENEKIKLEKEALRLNAEKKEKELALLVQEQKAKEAELKTKELESEAQQQQLALVSQRLKAEQKARELEESQRQQQLQQLELEAATEREERKQQELEAAKKEKEAQSQLLEREKEISNITRWGARIGGAVALLIIGLILFFLRISRRNNKRLEAQNIEIEQQRSELEKSNTIIHTEREKSEKLLLNILPAAIAEELKEKGFATPQKYDSVTVLFTDFGGFTRISSSMNADVLIEELNTCFTAFDSIIEKYNMEPIKTIGDSYMCAGGVPIVNSVNPSDVVRAALEMSDFMQKRLAEKQSQNIPYWDTRIGIHTGPVIAGVVGRKKFAYDIWGDAVNTASRMESMAELNTVNISEATYELVKNDFSCVYRGEFDVKHKGIMKMYRVEKSPIKPLQ